MMPTVAVTGGTGFVGRFVISELLGRGHDVISLVRAASSVAPDTIEAFRGHGVRHIIAGDLNTPNYGAVLPAGIMAVVHCAARVHVMRDRATDPLADFRGANVDATLSLARHAARKGVKRFIYLSSIKVNGDRAEVGHPFSSHDVPKPQDPYGISKMEAEAGLWKLSEETGLAITIIRPPLVYGRGVKGNMALLARLIQSGLPVPLGGITENRRSLVAVENLADLVGRCVTHPGAINRTFLASDGEDESTARLIRLMAEAMGRPVRLISIPPDVIRLVASFVGRSGLAERLCGSLVIDTSPTRQQLKWTPPYALRTALAAAFAPKLHNS